MSRKSTEYAIAKGLHADRISAAAAAIGVGLDTVLPPLPEPATAALLAVATLLPHRPRRPPPNLFRTRAAPGKEAE